MYRTIIKKLNNWKKSLARKPLILLGARQIGKTYILNEFGNKNFKKVFYINFERDKRFKEIFDIDLNPKRIIQELEFSFKNQINKKEDLLIFDEIQTAPQALTSLKYFCEELPEMAICAAGSFLGIKHGESSFPVGKVDVLNMYPMSFEEFVLATEDLQVHEVIEKWEGNAPLPQIVHEELFHLWKIYLIVGGLPEAVHTYKKNKDELFNSFILVRNLQSEIINIHLADIAKHSGKVNSMHIERLWSNIPSQLAREQNGTAPKFKFKGIIPSVKGYERLVGAIDWLLATGLILKVPIVNSGELPFKAYAKENVFKLFVYDVGILGALSDLSPAVIYDYKYGTYKGYFAENFVAQEFTCSFGRPDKLYAWTEGKSEVEFLREVNKKAVPIEVKSGFNTSSRSLQVFMKKYKSPYGGIFHAGNFKKGEIIYKYPLYTAYKFPFDF